MLILILLLSIASNQILNCDTFIDEFLEHFLLGIQEPLLLLLLIFLILKTKNKIRFVFQVLTSPSYCIFVTLHRLGSEWSHRNKLFFHFFLGRLRRLGRLVHRKLYVLHFAPLCL